MTSLALRAADVMRRVFVPRTKLTGSVWADNHGWIARSSGAGEHGRPHRQAQEGQSEHARDRDMVQDAEEDEIGAKRRRQVWAVGRSTIFATSKRSLIPNFRQCQRSCELLRDPKNDIELPKSVSYNRKKCAASRRNRCERVKHPINF